MRETWKICYCELWTGRKYLRNETHAGTMWIYRKMFGGKKTKNAASEDNEKRTPFTVVSNEKRQLYFQGDVAKALCYSDSSFFQERLEKWTSSNSVQMC